MALTVWMSELCAHDGELQATTEIIENVVKPYVETRGMDAHAVLQARVEGFGTDILLFFPGLTLLLELKQVGRNVSVRATENEWVKVDRSGHEEDFHESPYLQIKRQIGAVRAKWEPATNGKRLARIEGVVVISPKCPSDAEDKGFGALERLPLASRIYVRRIDEAADLLCTLLGPCPQSRFANGQEAIITDFISVGLGVGKAHFTVRGYIPECDVQEGWYTEEEKKATLQEREKRNIQDAQQRAEKKLNDAKKAGEEAERQKTIYEAEKEKYKRKTERLPFWHQVARALGYAVCAIAGVVVTIIVIALGGKSGNNDLHKPPRS